MKVQALKTAALSGSYLGVPEELQIKLNGKTINQCLSEGLIDDLGDNEGNFTFNQQDGNGVYALIQGHSVRLSEELSKMSDDEIVEMAGNLTFTRGVTADKLADGNPHPRAGQFWFRLGRPAGTRFGDARANIAGTVAEQAKDAVGA